MPLHLNRALLLALLLIPLLLAATAHAQHELPLVSQFGGWYNALAVSGDYTVLAQGANLTILDTRDPANPDPVGKLPTERLTEDVHVLGTLAFRAIAPAELRRRLANKAHTPEAQAPGARATEVIHKPAPDHPWRKAAIPRAADKQRF